MSELDGLLINDADTSTDKIVHWTLYTYTIKIDINKYIKINGFTLNDKLFNLLNYTHTFTQNSK